MILLNTGHANLSPAYENNKMLLERWGAKLPVEGLKDPVTETMHPRNGTPFMYTDKILAGPVSDKVRGIWYPCARNIEGSAFGVYGAALEVDTNWTVVVRGSESCYSEALPKPVVSSDYDKFTPYARPGRVPSPVLYAVREYGGGRMGLAALNKVFHLTSGTSWAHDRVMLGKGMANRPSDFNILLENTMRWLAQPSLDKGTLGGYQQDPLVLKHPHFRKKPSEMFPEFASCYQLAVPPVQVRGLVGAQTAYSVGKGTVADYAAAARQAKLDFVVFLEEFSAFNAEKLRKLEKDCADLSGPDLVLIPGYTLRNNIGNHMFFFGYENKLPAPTQLAGPNKDQLRLQGFDAQGKLDGSGEDAKNLLWFYLCGNPNQGPQRNMGYFNFTNSTPGSVPVRNLRLYGMLGAVTYLDGKFVEDVTSDYLKLTPQGNPPRMCAVDIVKSPAELEAAVKAGHYLTHVVTYKLEDVMRRMIYGHQYSRDNVYPSTGPRIHAWGGTHRLMTYAGEPFVTARYRIPHLAQVSSDVGLKEIRIYCDGKLWRRILLNGEKEFKRVFEWSFDRQRGLVLEAFDTAGGRAVSTSFETWTDANALSWCGDRMNGELWHGPFDIKGVWQSGVLCWYSIGQTWDGGGALTPFAGINYRTQPNLIEKDGKTESRPMEGYTYATCVDDSVRNIAGEAWNVYAPGSVGNAYSTLGPIQPAEQMTFRLRRTMYVPRVVGPLLDWHAWWSERSGGGMALFEGKMTLKKDVAFGQIGVGGLGLVNFGSRQYSGPLPAERVALWAIRKDNDSPPLCGTEETIGPGNVVSLGIVDSNSKPMKAWDHFPISRGGYIGTFGVEQGTPSAIFNVGKEDLSYFTPFRQFYIANLPAEGKAGQKFSWSLFYVWDGFDHDVRNLGRLERIRAYFGLDGKGNSGIVVKQGKLLSHFGLVDLAPAKGIVEFEVPQPDFNLDVPLGLRFIGFNPNWTVGQFQISGYSPGFYSKGANVYRNLGTDDRDMVHLAVYTKGVPKTHCIVGHPVQCNAQDLIIEVTHLNDNPAQWYVAVNNPTDKPIKTVLKRAMDLPGFEFPDTPVAVPAGGYQVIKEK